MSRAAGVWRGLLRYSSAAPVGEDAFRRRHAEPTPRHKTFYAADLRDQIIRGGLSVRDCFQDTMLADANVFCPFMVFTVPIDCSLDSLLEPHAGLPIEHFARA